MLPTRRLYRLSAYAALALIVFPAARPAQAQAPASSSSSSGFATVGNDPFAMGEKVVFAGLSLGVFGGVYGTMSVPPLYAGFDYAFHKYMTLGGVFAFSRYDYRTESLTYLTFAARGTFHPIFWLERVKVPIDPYGIATVGWTVGNYSGPGSFNYSYPVIGPGVGIRYWFNPRWSGQAETGVGSGLGLASVAIAYKF